MNEDDPETCSPGKRVAVFTLSSMLAGFGVYSWYTGVGNPRLLWMLGVGAVLGMIYAVRGGTLPEIFYLASAGKITHDDDPANLPAKVYLPILLGAILLAAVICYVYYPRH